MPSRRDTGASGRWAGHEPTPSLHAASIMFCAQRPASNACSRVWTITIAHDHEPIGFLVLRAPGHACGLENAPERVLGNWPIQEAPLISFVDDGTVRVHAR